MTAKNEIGMKSKQRDRFLHSPGDRDRDGSHGGGEFDLKKKLAPAVLVVV